MAKTFIISLIWLFDLVSVHVMMASNLNGLGCISPEFMEPMNITLKYCWPFISSAIYANWLHAYLGTSLLRMVILVQMHVITSFDAKIERVFLTVLDLHQPMNGQSTLKLKVILGIFEWNSMWVPYEFHVHILISLIQMVRSHNISTPIIFHANHKDIDKMRSDKINCSTFVCRNLMWWAA